MALPSAQLGGMSSLNTPSYVPTIAVQPKEKTWQKVLLSALAGAAQGVGSGAAQNVMARDYAPEGEKAGFWGKLTSGPVKGEREMLQGKAHEQDLERIGAQTLAALGLKEYDAAPGPRDAMVAGEAQLNAADGRIADSQRMLAGMRESRYGREARAEEGEKSRAAASAEGDARRKAQAIRDLENRIAALKQQKLSQDFQGRQDTERNGLIREQTRQLSGQNKQAELLFQQLQKSDEAQKLKDPNYQSPGQVKVAERLQTMPQGYDPGPTGIMGFLKEAADGVRGANSALISGAGKAATYGAKNYVDSAQAAGDLFNTVEDTRSLAAGNIGQSVSDAIFDPTATNPDAVDPQQLLIAMHEARRTMPSQSPEEQAITAQRIQQMSEMYRRIVDSR